MRWTIVAQRRPKFVVVLSFGARAAFCGAAEAAWLSLGNVAFDAR